MKNQTELDTEGYTVVRGLMTPKRAASLVKYYEKRISRGLAPLGDKTSKTRYWEKAESAGMKVLAEACEPAKRICGRNFVPGFSYFMSYLPGSALPPHIDGDDTVLSASIFLGHSEPEDDKNVWPLFFRKRRATKNGRADLKPGDAVFFKGTETLHWRNELQSKSRYSLLCLFFYEVPPKK